MKLLDALAVASQYVDPKSKEAVAYNVVVLRGGMLRATNGLTGCAIPCEDIEGVDLAVDCASMIRMIKAIGEPALKQVKGRALEIKGGGVRYKLRAVPKSAEPPFPDVPKSGWSPVEEAQMAALSAISGIVDTKNPNQALTGVRLHPHWCAGAAKYAMAFAWITKLVDEPFTVPPGVFDGMTEAADLIIEDPRLFLRDCKTEQIRWSIGLAADWPDASLASVIVETRKGARSTLQVDLADLGLLCRQASVVGTDRAEGFKLTVDSTRMALTGAQGLADFYGKVKTKRYVPGAEQEWVGVRPDRLGLVCSVVAGSGGEPKLSIGGPLQPIMVWGGDPVIIEALSMPVHLDAG